MRVALRLSIMVWVAVALTATWTRAQAWTNERTLWIDAVAQAPDKPRPMVNLAKQYAVDGALDLAATYYTRALNMAGEPGRSRDEQVYGVGFAAANLAILRCQAGDLRGAYAIVEHFLQRSAYADGTLQPIATVLKDVYQWLKQRQNTGGCVPVSSF